MATQHITVVTLLQTMVSCSLMGSELRPYHLMGAGGGGKVRVPVIAATGEFPLTFSSVKYMTHSEF